jgi:hypothetical protein
VNASSVGPHVKEAGVADGRKVLDLHSGPNNIRALVPGVYFVEEGLGTRGQGLGRIRKVVLTR